MVSRIYCPIGFFLKCAPLVRVAVCFFFLLQKSNVGADQLQLDRIVRLLPLWQVWTSLALSIDHGLSLRRVRAVTIAVEPKPITQGNGQMIIPIAPAIIVSLMVIA
jgi:hypothetical protein